MRYPQELIHNLGGPAIFAEIASEHEKAPGRKLTRDAIYMWSQRGEVPFMWRPVVEALTEAPESCRRASEGDAA